MSAYGTKIAEGFSGKVMQFVYDNNLLDTVVNRNYEGEINGVGSKLNILDFAKLSEKTFAKWLSYIKDPHPYIVTQVGNERSKNMDTFVFDLHPDVGSGNRVGTDYTTGDVEVAVTTGVVTGNGTTFTAAMVGRGFKATGHTTWYRIKTYTSATSITIEDDLDDSTSAYTG